MNRALRAVASDADLCGRIRDGDVTAVVRLAALMTAIRRCRAEPGLFGEGADVRDDKLAKTIAALEKYADRTLTKLRRQEQTRPQDAPAKLRAERGLQPGKLGRQK